MTPDGGLRFAAVSTVHIRPATHDDHDELLALDIRSWVKGTSPGPPYTDDEDFFERVGPADHLLAVQDDRIVGYVRLGHPTPLPASAHVLEIRGLAVDPWARGRGLGERLVHAAIEEARRRGAHKVSLRVLGTNPTARRLYSRCGFEVQGHLREEFLIDGELVDDFMMALIL